MGKKKVETAKMTDHLFMINNLSSIHVGKLAQFKPKIPLKIAKMVRASRAFAPWTYQGKTLNHWGLTAASQTPCCIM